MKQKIFLLLGLILIISACSVYHVDSINTTDTYYPTKKTAQDVVYLEKIDRPAEVIGQITVNTERHQQMSEVLERMKYEAAILGGDAFTNIQTNATGSWKHLPAQKMIGNAYIRANFTADVVVFQ
jgi:hypothetical protein